VTNKANIRFPAVERDGTGADRSNDRPARANDDTLTARLLAVHGTNEARQRTCRVLGRGIHKRFKTEVQSHRILSVTCSWTADDFCTALVEVEYGAYCCKSWSWLLVKACGLLRDPRPFEWVELDHEDATVLRRALTRMETVQLVDDTSHS
jgi:hypothetical protein